MNIIDRLRYYDFNKVDNPSLYVVAQSYIPEDMLEASANNFFKAAVSLARVYNSGTIYYRQLTFFIDLQMDNLNEQSC